MYFWFNRLFLTNGFIILFQKTPDLESINFSGCHHLTDKTINSICKNLHHIQQVNLSQVPAITEQAVFKLLTKCPMLTHLDIYDNRNISKAGRDNLKDMCTDRERNLTVILDGLLIDISEECNSSNTLQLASVGKFW